MKRKKGQQFGVNGSGGLGVVRVRWGPSLRLLRVRLTAGTRTTAEANAEIPSGNDEANDEAAGMI